MNDSAIRGRPFKKGQSGNPKGRPRGSKNRPKETTMEQEAEALRLRGAAHVITGEIDAARDAFTKMFVLLGLPSSGDELHSAANSLIETEQIEAARDSRFSSLQSLYQDEINEGAGDYFQHIGLPKDATWEQFRAHYAVHDGDVDATRAFEDLAAYPPIAARIAELKAEQAV